jgi:hypothetical protein
VRVAIRRALPVVLRLVAVAGAMAVLSRVVAAGPMLGWPQVHVLVGIVVPGAGLGLALAAGPLWGALTFAALGGGFALMVPAQASDAVPATIAGAAVTVVVAMVINVGARRGFATTEVAIRAAEAADLARLRAERRLLARRRMDRILHDTVLSTLTLLAYGGRGVAPEQVRGDCRRDLAALRSDRWSGTDQVAVPVQDAPGARPGTRIGRDVGNGADIGIGKDLADGVGTVRLPRQLSPFTQRLDDVRELAARHGVDLRVHVQSCTEPTGAAVAGPVPTPTRSPVAGGAAGAPRPLGGTAFEAWSSALAECVTNIGRHAGVTAADVVLGGTDSLLVTLVVDEGNGFETGQVVPERLGLSGSVRDRLHDVGGAARVWSRPGEGTVVELVLPWPQNTAEAGS